MDTRDLAYIAMEKSPNLYYMADINTHQLIYLNEVAKKLHGFTDNTYI